MPLTPPGWNPMDTAPKRDGEPILVLVPAGLITGIPVVLQVEWRGKRFDPSGIEAAPHIRRGIDEALGWKPI